MKLIQMKYTSLRSIALLLLLVQSVTFAPKSADAAGVVYSFLFPTMATRDSGGTNSVDPVIGKLLLAASLASIIGLTINLAHEDYKRDQKAQRKLLRLLKKEPKRVKRALIKQEGATYNWLVNHIAKFKKTERRSVFDCIISQKISILRTVFKLKSLRTKQQRIISILQDTKGEANLGLTTHPACKELWKKTI